MSSRYANAGYLGNAVRMVIRRVWSCHMEEVFASLTIIGFAVGSGPEERQL